MRKHQRKPTPARLIHIITCVYIYFYTAIFFCHKTASNFAPVPFFLRFSGISSTPRSFSRTIRSPAPSTPSAPSLQRAVTSVFPKTSRKSFKLNKPSHACGPFPTFWWGSKRFNFCLIISSLHSGSIYPFTKYQVCFKKRTWNFLRSIRHSITSCAKLSVAYSHRTEWGKKGKAFEYVSLGFVACVPSHVSSTHKKPSENM